MLQSYCIDKFLKHTLGVRDSTANVIVIAELGRFPLCFHWWQQILRYHKRINNLCDDERLIKCAFVEGMHDPAHLFWSHKIHSWLQGQSVGLSIEDDLDVSTVPLIDWISDTRPQGCTDLQSAGEMPGS